MDGLIVRSIVAENLGFLSQNDGKIGLRKL
jgi:hypothetical protein